jgi:streptogramin lyase
MGIGNGTMWTGAAPVPASSNLNRAFYNPVGVAVDASGNLFVTESYGQRVQKIDSSGNFLLKWGGTGSGTAKGQFNFPQGIVVDGAGSVYVADTSNNRVQRFTSDGRFVQAFGSGGSVAPVPGGLFANPTGIALSANGNTVYVTDRQNHRVQRFERFGFNVTATPTSRTIAAGATTTFDLKAKLVGANTLDTRVAFKILSGRPAGSTAAFSRLLVKPTAAGSTTTLTIGTLPGTAPKTFQIPVEIEGGGQTRVVTLSLQVTP